MKTTVTEMKNAFDGLSIQDMAEARFFSGYGRKPWVPSTYARDLRELLRVLFPSPGDLPDPGIESRSPPLQADSLSAEL